MSADDPSTEGALILMIGIGTAVIGSVKGTTDRAKIVTVLGTINISARYEILSVSL
jgi:hypothetical protein